MTTTTKQVINYCHRRFLKEGYAHRPYIEESMLHVMEIVIKRGQEWLKEMINQGVINTSADVQTIIEQFKNDLK